MDTGSLRDTIEASFDTQETSVETPIEKVEQPRDEKGQFATKDAAAPELPGVTPDAPPPAGETEPPPPPPVVAAPRPSSWKKEYWEKYDNIAKTDPDLANYIVQREKEFASGVSTFKAEAENAKQLNEAIAPFLPKLQQHGVKATDWIRDLGTAHEILALGSPHDKVMMGARLIRDYGIDPQQLFNVLSNPQAMQTIQQPQQDIGAVVQRTVNEMLQSREIQSEYQRFINATDDKGQPKYPHFEAVKETMAGLLQAELAQDYESAYEAALRHPRHADIFQSMQQQQHQLEEQKRQEASRQAVNRARSGAVSVKSATPTNTQTTGNKGLRESLSEAFDAVSSRV